VARPLRTYKEVAPIVGGGIAIISGIAIGEWISQPVGIAIFLTGVASNIAGRILGHFIPPRVPGSAHDRARPPKGVIPAPDPHS